jgi:hypothetical protein
MEATWLSTGDEVAGWIVEVEEEERVDDEVDGIVADDTKEVSVMIDVEVPEVANTTMVVVGSVAVPESMVLDGAADGAADGDSLPAINDVFGCWFWTGQPIPMLEHGSIEQQPSNIKFVPGTWQW